MRIRLLGGAPVASPSFSSPKEHHPWGAPHPDPLPVKNGERGKRQWCAVEHGLMRRPKRDDFGRDRFHQLGHCERSEAIQGRVSNLSLALDCFVAFAPRNDGKIRLNLNLLTASTRDVCGGHRRRNRGS
jgi:hypothetical protein